MKKLILIAAIASVGFGLTACGASAGDSKESQEQRQDTTNLVQNQPVPIYTYSQIRQNLIELETAQADGVQTTSFFFNQGVENPIFSCPSIGSPIATTTSLTNPWQSAYGNSSGTVAISQMDPNGIYSGDSSGTYVMCVGADGKPFAHYWEGFVSTVYGPATWNSTTKQIQMIGTSSFKFTGPKR